MRKVMLTGISQATVSDQDPLILKPVVILTIWWYFFSDPSYPQLPYNSPKTTGLRRMASYDVPEAFTLFNQYVSHFKIGQHFETKDEFLHYFLCPSMPGHTISYVVEDPISNSITDMFAFRLDSSGGTLGASVTIIIPSKTSPRQLITDMLLCAEQEQVYNLASMDLQGKILKTCFNRPTGMITGICTTISTLKLTRKTFVL